MQPEVKRRFYHRFLRASFLAGTVIGLSLLLGILGYHFIAGFGWIDSLLDASMILSGMGPVKTLDSSAAKVFASCYALFSGVVFISAITSGSPPPVLPTFIAMVGLSSRAAAAR